MHPYFPDWARPVLLIKQDLLLLTKRQVTNVKAKLSSHFFVKCSLLLLLTILSLKCQHHLAAKWTTQKNKSRVKLRRRYISHLLHFEFIEPLTARVINWHLINSKMAMGCCHSSVDSSARSNLPLWVQVPSTPSTLLSVFIWIVSCWKDENKQKEVGIGPFFKKTQKWLFLALSTVNSK